VEPAEKDIMERKPRPVNESVITRFVGLLIFLQALSMSLLAFGVYMTAIHLKWGASNTVEQQSLTFAALVSMQLVQGFLSKSITNSIFKTGFTSNPWMILAIFVSYGLLVLGMQAPGISTWLEFVPLGGVAWGIVLCVSLIHAIFVEILKAIVRCFI
jgi:Ca2+-transporting ATPase